MARNLSAGLVPAWLRRTEGEARRQAATAIAVAIALQFPVPGRLVLSIVTVALVVARAVNILQ